MIWVDYVFIGIVLFSVLIGLLRGLVREALSLAAWIFALVLTLRYAPALGEFLQTTIQTAAVRTAVAYALVFFVVLLIGALITWMISKLVRSVGLGGVDRMLGAGFGLLRGAFIVVAIVMLAGATAARQDAWWRKSLLVPELEPSAVSLRSLIPERWLAYLQPRDTLPNPSAEP